MGDIEKAALTALFAVFVYVCGQLIQKLFLEPIQEQRRIIGEIAFAIVYYANVSDPLDEREIEEKREARDAIRKLGSQLRATLATIPCYEILVRLNVVRSKEAIMKASADLIGFSNTLGKDEAYDKRKAIATALNIAWKT